MLFRLRISGYFLTFTVLVLTACNMGWGPPRDLSGFESAALIDDGKAAVFSYQRVAYRPATGWRAFPDGGPAKYIKDTRYAGVWEPESGKVRILAKFQNKGKKLLPGTWDMHVDKAMGQKVIIRRSGQKKADYMFETHTYWLDLKNGELSPLPIDEVLASMGQDLDYYYLVDDRGTLVLVSHEIGKKPDASVRIEKSDLQGKSLILTRRTHDGSYEEAAAIDYLVVDRFIR